MDSVTIVSILRLRSLIFFANSSNPTWDQWSIAYWSTIEVNVGMICTCLPSLRLILLRLFPQLGSGSRSGRSYGVQSQAQTNASKRLSNKEQHHLSDLESSKGHPWQRIGQWLGLAKRLLEATKMLTGHSRHGIDILAEGSI